MKVSYSFKIPWLNANNVRKLHWTNGKSRVVDAYGALPDSVKTREVTRENVGWRAATSPAPFPFQGYPRALSISDVFLAVHCSILQSRNLEIFYLLASSIIPPSDVRMQFPSEAVDVHFAEPRAFQTIFGLS